MLKRIFTFDLNRILTLDVNRILYWDIGRARIPSLLLRIWVGLMTAGLVMPMVVVWAERRGWHVTREVMWSVVALTCIATCASPDIFRALLRMAGSRRV